MSDPKIAIAKKLMESLAMHADLTASLQFQNRDITAVKKIIGVARANYVLPSFCAEISASASDCIGCILEHDLPDQCQKKLVEDTACDFDIDWDNG